MKKPIRMIQVFTKGSDQAEINGICTYFNDDSPIGLTVDSKEDASFDVVRHFFPWWNVSMVRTWVEEEEKEPKRQ